MEVPHVDIVKKKLGAEAVAALQALFKAAEGQPPGVPVARFRADHPEWMDVLDKLEHNHSLVERNKECTNYKIRSYALPLIDEASPLLEKMQQLYLRFRVLYQEELNGQQSIKKLLDKVEGDADEWMVALYYLSECHSIWSGKDIGFPYADDSYLCISESVLKNESVAEILSQYYEWHYINNQNRTNNESSSTERHNKIGILGWLQIGMLLFLVLNIVAAVLLYRHQTLHVFANVWTYLGSVKIAAPPLVIAIMAVLLAIVHEGTIADLRAKVVRWIRNHLMQHKRMLVITNMLLTSCFLGMAYILMYVTPPEYEVLVSKFLGSENDKFKVIGEKIDAIEKVNSTHAENLRHAANVFKLRAEINSHTIDQRQVLAASLTRALEVNTKLDSGWAEHPLRLHALAESYSIRSESMLDDAAGGPFSKENLVKHALENYKKSC